MQLCLGELHGTLPTWYQRDTNTYLLFFVWESGFKEAILNSKDDLLSDPAFRGLVKKVSE